MKVRFILSFLAALFIAGNMIAIESTDRVERKLPVVLKGEVPTTTHRSIPVQEVCQVTAPGQTTSFSIEGWAPGVYKLEFKVAEGGYVYGELVIE